MNHMNAVSYMRNKQGEKQDHPPPSTNKQIPANTNYHTYYYYCNSTSFIINDSLLNRLVLYTTETLLFISLF